MLQYSTTELCIQNLQLNQDKGKKYSIIIITVAGPHPMGRMVVLRPLGCHRMAEGLKEGDGKEER